MQNLSSLFMLLKFRKFIDKHGVLTGQQLLH